MTLDIAKYIKNLIEREFKISHFNVKIHAGKTADLEKAIEKKIKEQNGDTFLQDANYILIFVKEDGWSEADKKKVFSYTNRALGKDANTMTQNDFKVLKESIIVKEENEDINDDPEEADTDAELDAKINAELGDEPVDTGDDNSESPEKDSSSSEKILFMKITVK